MPRLNPRRVPTRRLDPAGRNTSFSEIELGYSLPEAMAEAERCLQCPAQPCVAACPAQNAIPRFIGALRDGRLEDAVVAIDENNSLPAICSRVCDHARQCEGACVVGKRGDPVGIGRLERFVADWERGRGLRARRPGQPTGRRAAIVGAGPAGLAAAALLAERGHEVGVYDRLPVMGGVLAAGIPTFRLPAEVVAAEVGRLADLGVAFYGGVRLGQDIGLEEVFLKGYQAILLAIGAPTPATLGVPGSDLPGVMTATDFLTSIRLRSERPTVGRVVVLGGGNTAMDVAQTALRLGASEVTVVYRRSRAELPARQEEIEVAEEEGVRFEFLAAPARFVADARGRLERIVCSRMTLGEPGPDGRRTPVPVAGQALELPADLAVLALGYGPDPALRAGLADVQLDERGYLRVDPSTSRTSRPGLWAAGDAVTGPNTVVAAMAAGRRAAGDMHTFLLEQPVATAPGP